MPKGKFVYSKADRDELILAALGEGKTNPQIAASLGLTRSTVRGYVSELLEEFDATTRTEAVMRAIELGRLPLPRRSGA